MHAVAYAAAITPPNAYAMMLSAQRAHAYSAARQRRR